MRLKLSIARRCRSRIAALLLGAVHDARARLSRPRHRQHDPAGAARRRRRAGAGRQALLAPAPDHARHPQGRRRRAEAARPGRRPHRARGPTGERASARASDSSRRRRRRRRRAASPARARAGLVPRPQRRGLLSRRPGLPRRSARSALANWQRLRRRAVLRERTARRGTIVDTRTQPRTSSAALRPRRARARPHPVRLLSLRMDLRHAEGRGAAAPRADARRARRGHDPEGRLALQHPVERRAAGLHRHPVLRAAAARASPGSATGSSASCSSIR